MRSSVHSIGGHGGGSPLLHRVRPASEEQILRRLSATREIPSGQQQEGQRIRDEVVCR